MQMGPGLLLSKRLERGTFDLAVAREDTRQVTGDSATLTALLEGIDLTAAWLYGLTHLFR